MTSVFRSKQWLTVFLLLLSTTFQANATQYIYTFHTFNGQDGSNPGAPLVQAKDGNFYGTTPHGGANGTGVVFKITQQGVYSVLYNFGVLDINSLNANGASPNALTPASDGNLYGTALYGGAYGNGTIFRITPTGIFTRLHAFSKYTPQSISVPGGTTTIYTNGDGARPASMTLGKDGNLYGVTTYGGLYGNGLIFSMTLAGTLTRLHSFGAFHFNQPIPYAQQTDLTNLNGANPQSALIQATDGNFYGVAPWGGPQGSGTIFKVTPAGDLSRVADYGGGYLYRIKNNTSQGPAISFNSAIETVTITQGTDGNFYGTTSGKAADPQLEPKTDFGTIFRLTTAGVKTTLHTFTMPDVKGHNDDGAAPAARLVVGANGRLYGTTSAGGEDGAGIIFELSLTGTRTTLYSFAGGDGSVPQAQLLVAQDGNLYGTATYGGSGGYGVLFEVAPKPPAVQLYSFDGTNGSAPICVMQAKDGNFYGVCYSSTTRGIGCGTVFKIQLKGDTAKLTTLHEFPYARPNAPLIQGKDGVFYGTTGWGATDGDHVYRVTSAGDYSLLYNFAGQHDTVGGLPFAGIIQAKDGNFYGTNSSNGPAGSGTLFQLTPAGGLTVLHSFGYTAAEGYQPDEPLLQASDGYLYGIAGRGGVAANSADGVIFKASTSGKFRILHQFDPSVESYDPAGGLAEGPDGYLYGTTFGIYQPPGIYKLPRTATKPSDIVHLHSFSYAEGGSPGGLLAASDGYLYGLLGGTDSFTGSIYRITPQGDFAFVHHFHGDDGAGDFAGPPIQAKDGNLYGVSPNGGQNGYGTFFRLAIARPRPVTLIATALSMLSDSYTRYKGKAGQQVVFKANLHTVTGNQGLSGITLTFTIDGTKVGANMTTASGSSWFSYTLPATLAVGAHTITVKYAGDSQFAASQTTGTLTVTN